MDNQMIFKRYEIKYLLNPQQLEAVQRAMKPYMQLDQFGHAQIRNIYYDTDTWRLVRRSIEKPVYKEKFRVRSYGCPTADSLVYAELKKKYDGVVYKRRVALHLDSARKLGSGMHLAGDGQIEREINYFCDFYETLHPVMFLSYEREAFYMKDGSDFRVTVDTDIQARTNKLDLAGALYGSRLLAGGQTLMELKTPGAIPLWMVRVLSEQRIYKTTFSKYGEAYERLVAGKERGEIRYA